MEELSSDVPIARFSCTRYSSHGVPYRGEMVIHIDHLTFRGRAIPVLLSTQDDLILFKDVDRVYKTSFLGIPTLIGVTTVDGKSRYYGSFMMRRTAAHAALVHFVLAARRPPAFLACSSVNHHKWHGMITPETQNRLLGKVGNAARQLLLSGSLPADRNTGKIDFSGTDIPDDDANLIRVALERQKESQASLQRSLQMVQRAQKSGEATLSALGAQGDQLRRIDRNLDNMDHDLRIGDRVIKDMERPFLIGVIMPLSNVGPTSSQAGGGDRRLPAQKLGPNDSISTVALTTTAGRAQVPFLMFGGGGSSESASGNAYTPMALDFADGSPTFSLCDYAHEGTVSDDATVSHVDAFPLSAVSHIVIPPVPCAFAIAFRNGAHRSIVGVSAFRRGIVEEIVFRCARGDLPKVVYEKGAADVGFREREGLRVVNRPPPRDPTSAEAERATDEPGQKQKGSSSSWFGGSSSSSASSSAAQQRPKGGLPASHPSSQLRANDDAMDETLTDISAVTASLHQMALAMGGEIDNHTRLISSIDEKVDRNTSKIVDQTKRSNKLM